MRVAVVVRVLRMGVTVRVLAIGGRRRWCVDGRVDLKVAVGHLFVGYDYYYSQEDQSGPGSIEGDLRSASRIGVWWYAAATRYRYPSTYVS